MDHQKNEISREIADIPVYNEYDMFNKMKMTHFCLTLILKL